MKTIEKLYNIQIIVSLIVICTIVFMHFSCVPQETKEEIYKDNYQYNSSKLNRITYHYDPYNKDICYAIILHYKGIGLTTVPCEKIKPEKLSPLTQEQDQNNTQCK